MTPAEALASRKTWHRPKRNGPARSVKRIWHCRVREVREALHLSLRDVAKSIHLSITALFQIEHGGDPQLTTARRIATFFGWSVEDLWPAIARRGK